MIALVRLVISRSTALGSIFKVPASQSASTGRAPAKTIALAVAANVIVEVMTSSPRPMPAARRAR